MKSKIGAAQQAATKHPPASAEAKAAQNAAVAPPNDKDAQAKAAKADEMGAAKPGPFDKAGFIAAVNKAIAAQAPKNLDEADKFASSGKADNVKAEVMGKVTKGKEDSVKPLAEKSQQAPDTSKAVDKPVTPLPATKPETKPAPLDAAKAMPPKAPAEQTNLGAPKCETDKQMAEAGVTEGQLAKSNEPQFTEAVAAKKEGEAHSATAPAQVRQSEAQQLNAARAGAQDAGQAGAAAMAGARGRALQQVAGQQGDTKSKDEAKRREVTGPINAIFDKTKTEVTKILGDLDGLVSTKFEEGERQAKAAFTADHQARMQRYKDQRYSGPAGWLRWTGDLFADLPAEANQLFVESRKLYELKMQAVISDIADLVGRELTRAKERVAAGRAEIAKHVAGLSPDLRKVGAEAAKEIGGKFDELDAAVDEKSQSLVADLASKYVEARNAVDDEIKQLQEQNKGLWSKAKDAVGGAIETILKLKDMLLGVLARAAGAIENVIKDPIGFLGKFVNAVKTGITNFASNIVDHLKKGLQGWLLGSLANAGIELPEKFDLKGIVKLVLSMLGLTWSGIRARLTKFIPEPVLLKIEQTVEIFKILVTEGVGGLWKWIVGKLTDLKDMVMGQIRDFVITKIVKAGITWLISLLNPAAAFIKACKMIYDVVMFFVEKADQIKEFVDSVLDSIESIAKGGVGAVAGYIEKTLAKTLPVVLGFLASLLGLGGISEKIKGILKAAQEKVGEAVDWVIKKALKVAAPLIKAFKKGADWVKGKVAAGKAWVKGKYEAGKAWVKKKYEVGKTWVKDKLGGKKNEDDGKKPPTAGRASRAELERQAAAVLTARLRQPHSPAEAKQIIGQVSAELAQHGVKRLELGPERRDGTFPIMMEASPIRPLREFLRMAPPGHGRGFRCVAKVTLDAGVLLQWNQMVDLQDPGRSLVSSLPGPDYRRIVQERGVDPRAAAAIRLNGGNEIAIVARATGEYSRAAATSHGEYYFYNWLSSRSRSQPWLQSVTEIEVSNFPYNPCSVCGGGLARVLQEIRDKREGKPLKATLHWDGSRPWAEEELPRIRETLVTLTTAGWAVSPATVDESAYNRQLQVAITREA